MTDPRRSTFDPRGIFLPYGTGCLLARDAEELLRRIHASGQVWLPSAPINGRRYIRMCILSHRSTRERIEEAVDIILAAAAR